MATYLGYPFNPELFSYLWTAEKDLVLTNMLDSGAVVESAELANLISTGSDLFTLPFYKTISGDPSNYDGQTDISVSDTQGASQSGIVFGRSKGFRAKDFVFDYNSGADPMAQIVSQMAKYWNKQRQTTLLAVLSGIFGVSEADWNTHKIDISVASGTPASGNKIGATTVGDAIVDALGDNGDEVKLAFMHSRVAANCANLNLLDFVKYTDAMGVQRQLKIGQMNGVTVVINDNVPTEKTLGTAGVFTVKIDTAAVANDTFTLLGKTYTWVANGTEETDTTIALPSTSNATNQASAIVTKLGTNANYTITSSGATISFTEKVVAGAVACTATGTMKVSTGTTTESIYNTVYTTYLFGQGAILHAVAPVKVPAEVSRDAGKNGGEDILYTRIREVYHPNGFNFAKPGGYTASPLNSDLANSANWSVVFGAKAIPMIRIKSNG